MILCPANKKRVQNFLVGLCIPVKWGGIVLLQTADTLSTAVSANVSYWTCCFKMVANLPCIEVPYILNLSTKWRLLLALTTIYDLIYL